MKVQELQIGDLVDYRGKVIEVTSLYAKKGSNEVGFGDREDCWVNGDVVKPIELTDEILQKNGFHFGNTASEEDFCNSVGCLLPEEGWCYDEGAGEIKIIFPNESDGGLLRLDDQNADRHLELIFCNPLMVHQLQQALRLCGIDKEIVV